jgi:CTP synthase
MAEQGCFTGSLPIRKFVEIVELKDHPWFWPASSPEFKSRPLLPHPLFSASSGGEEERDRRRARPAARATGVVPRTA